MNNEQEKNFESLYFKHAKYIEHLAEECIKLKDKFGTESQIYKSKVKSLQFLRQFHDETIDYFNNITKAFNMLQCNYEMLRVRSFAMEVDLSLPKSLEILGSNDKKNFTIENCTLLSEMLKIDQKIEIEYIINRETKADKILKAYNDK